MLSPKSARKAVELGYTNVKVYHDGLPVWKKQKNAVYSSISGLKNFREKDIPYILLDTRSDLSGGVIPGAVAATAASIEGMKGDFPKSKKAPVIVYGPEAEKVFAVVRGWKYKSASILSGGAAEWTKAGQALADKPLAKVAYVPKPRPGEVSPADFAKALGGDVVVLDVREADEVAAGSIKGAVAIPLDELEDRLADLPKGKKIVAQCSTGARAEMAYNVLKEKGYDVGWLNAKVSVDADGSYEVEE